VLVQEKLVGFEIIIGTHTNQEVIGDQLLVGFEEVK